MANTAPLSPDELAKKQKAVEGQIKTSMAKDIANAGFMGGRGLPSAPPADITKAARPLTGGASTPPPSAVGGMGPSTPPPSEVGGMGPSTPPPATNGFTPPAVTGGLAPYVKPSVDMRERLTPSDTSLIPKGDAGTASNMSIVGQNGEYIKTNMPVDQAKERGAKVLSGVESSTKGASIDPKKAAELQKGMTNRADETGAFFSGIADAVKKVYDQATAKPDYGKGFRDTNRYRK